MTSGKFTVFVLLLLVPLFLSAADQNKNKPLATQHALTPTHKASHKPIAHAPIQKKSNEVYQTSPAAFGKVFKWKADVSQYQ